jgi:hypothetical protein
MNAEAIVAALLSAPGVVALVGTRRALRQLPQGTAMPALVYQVVTANPTPELNIETRLARSRVQINPLAATVAEVKAIHAAVRATMDFLHAQTVAGKAVVSCRLDLVGLMDKDNEAGVWTQPADYLLQWYE